MAASLSSPLQAMDSSQRTLGRFVPLQTPTGAEHVSEPCGSFKIKLKRYHPARAFEEARKKAAAAAATSTTSEPGTLPVTPEKLSAAAKVDQMHKRKKEHRRLVNEIAQLQPRDQIDHLLQEVENLAAQIEMQDKAMNAMHLKSLRDKQALEQRLAGVGAPGCEQSGGDAVADSRLARLESLAKRDSESLEELVKRVEYLEEEGKESFVRCFKERMDADELWERVDIIEEGIEEVRGRLGVVARRLGASVRESEDEDPDYSPCRGEPAGGKRRDSAFESASRKRKGAVSPSPFSSFASKRLPRDTGK